METLALYRQLHAVKPPILSISPDLKSVAYDPERARFNDESGGSNIKLLPLIAGEGQHTVGIRWKADASMLFHVTWSQSVAGDPKSYVESVSIMNARTAETVQGKLPIGFNFMDGSFLDGGRELVVFMRPRNDLPESEPPGTVFRCSVAPFKCRPVVASVDHASMNEHGLVGTVAMIYNYRRNRHDSGWFAVPNKYVVNVLNVDGRILIRQELPGYSKKDQLSNGRSVSRLPSEIDDQTGVGPALRFRALINMASLRGAQVLGAQVLGAQVLGAQVLDARPRRRGSGPVLAHLRPSACV